MAVGTCGGAPKNEGSRRCPEAGKQMGKEQALQGELKKVAVQALLERSKHPNLGLLSSDYL